MAMTTGERKRGWWLSGWLILMALLYALLAYDAVTTRATSAEHSDSSAAQMQPWGLLLLIVLPMVNVGGAIALWFWRKVGLYLFIITSAPLFILNLQSGERFLDALFPLYFLTTLWILLEPRWKYFH
jgi:hypothetical protein